MFIPVGKEETIILPEVKEIMMAMDKYYSELSLIENVLHNWDPIKKTIVVYFYPYLNFVSIIRQRFIISCLGSISYNQV